MTPSPQLPPVRHPLSILVVDADHDQLQEAAQALKTRVSALHQASDGKEAWALFKAKRPDLVLTDMVLPALDGLELVARIRKQDEDIPILVSYDGYNPSALLKVLEYNISGFLIKPLDPAHLVHSVQRAARWVLLKRGLTEARYSLHHLLNVFPSPALLVREGKVTFANMRLLRYLGVPSWESFAEQGGGLERHIAALDQEPYMGETGEWIRRIVNDPVDREHLLGLSNPRQSGGKAGEFLVDFTPLPEPGAYLFTLSDVSELEEEKSALSHAAGTDPLTHTLNRRKLREHLEKETRLANAGGHTFSMIMFDIDHFKSVNDTFGHDVGDSVLREFTELAKNGLRDSDHLARWGGEEFMVLLPGQDQERARRIAERLRGSVESHQFEGVDRPVTASFGVAEYAPEAGLDKLLKLVDQALYMAKESGRNRVVFA